MFEKIIKRKTKYIYIFLFVVMVILLAYNVYNKYTSIKFEKYENLQKRINVIKKQNKILQDQLKKKKKEYFLVYSKLIDMQKLRQEMNLLIQGLQENGLVRESYLVSIDAPYQYLNVAKVVIHVKNKVDFLILKRIIDKLYNVKSIQYKNNNLIIEIYKE